MVWWGKITYACESWDWICAQNYHHSFLVSSSKVIDRYTYAYVDMSMGYLLFCVGYLTKTIYTWSFVSIDNYLAYMLEPEHIYVYKNIEYIWSVLKVSSSRSMELSNHLAPDAISTTYDKIIDI